MDRCLLSSYHFVFRVHVLEAWECAWKGGISKLWRVELSLGTGRVGAGRVRVLVRKRQAATATPALADASEASAPTGCSGRHL